MSYEQARQVVLKSAGVKAQNRTLEPRQRKYLTLAFHRQINQVAALRMGIKRGQNPAQARYISEVYNRMSTMIDFARKNGATPQALRAMTKANEQIWYVMNINPKRRPELGKVVWRKMYTALGRALNILEELHYKLQSAKPL